MIDLSLFLIVIPWFLTIKIIFCLHKSNNNKGQFDKVIAYTHCWFDLYIYMYMETPHGLGPSIITYLSKMFSGTCQACGPWRETLSTKQRQS